MIVTTADLVELAGARANSAGRCAESKYGTIEKSRSRLEVGRSDDFERHTDSCPEAPFALLVPGGKSDEVQGYSDHLQEVIGVPPHGLIRWGNTITSLIVALLLVLSWMIHYPDVVRASIVMTTTTPPAVIVAQATGALIDVRARPDKYVKRGDLLAVIESSAEPVAVFGLKKHLSTLGSDPDHPDLAIDFAENYQLGELQSDYSIFIKNYKALRYYVEQDPVGNEIRTLEPQRDHYYQRLTRYRSQRDLSEKAVVLAGRDYQRTRELAHNNFVSLRDLDGKERELLQAHRALEGVQLDITGTLLDIDKLEQNLTQLRIRDRQQLQNLQLAFAESYKNLQSRLEVWERAYVLRSPIDGVVSLFRFWSNYQVVKTGTEVLTIVPENTQPPIGKLTMPLTNSGKVTTGQMAYIRLDNYPYQEYGLLQGTVTSVSRVPREANYAVEVAVPAILRTSFGKNLEFRQEMQGTAEIVTEDLRLLERIFYQIRKLLMGDADRGPVPRADPAL
jgi:multidrug resistance efflux pump